MLVGVSTLGTGGGRIVSSSSQIYISSILVVELRLFFLVGLVTRDLTLA